MQVRFALGAIAALFVFAGSANAACPEQFAGGAAPRVTGSVFAQGRTHERCYEEFAVWTSGATRTPLWSAEHLTANEVLRARLLPRNDDFHAEQSLPRDERAELADYSHSGFDRGHLAPSGDMPSAHAQQESFSLANIVPQNSALNRGVWEGLEASTRSLALASGEVYIVTGPIFAGAPNALRGRVLVPTALFKAVYDVRSRSAAAYVAQNSEPASYQVISIARLRELTGLDVYPSLPEAVKARAVDVLGTIRVADNMPQRRRPTALDIGVPADRPPRFAR